MRIVMKVRKIAFPDGNTPTVYEDGYTYEVDATLVPKMFKADEYSAVDPKEAVEHQSSVTFEEAERKKTEARAVTAKAVAAPAKAAS